MVNKNATAAFIFFLVASCLAGAQQITRIAVVDLQKITLAYSSDSTAVRDFENKKAQIQAELNRRGEELKRLQSQKVEYDRIGDEQNSSRTKLELEAKTEQLKEFWRVKQAELDEDARKLGSSNQLYQLVYKQIQQVAETEGFSLVLNLKSGDSVMDAVVWYSPMIDITDKVIQALIGKIKQ